MIFWLFNYIWWIIFASVLGGQDNSLNVKQLNNIKMKTKFNVLILIGVALFFLAPIYQTLDEVVKNVSGDGKRIYGDNPIFKNLLGIKTENYFEMDGQWEYCGTKIQTAPWMQKIGVNKFVYSGGGTYNDNSPTKEIILVDFLRFLVKIIIPLIFIAPGYYFHRKKLKN